LNGLEINNLTQGQRGNLQMGMEGLTKAHEIYVFCLSRSFDEKLKREFGAVACAEIFNPAELHSRWLKALPEEAKAQGRHVSRKVGYDRPEDLPGTVWALPDLITTTKLHHFAYQDESTASPTQKRTLSPSKTAPTCWLTERQDPRGSRRSITTRRLI
jgi:hypothetical protein